MASELRRSSLPASQTKGEEDGSLGNPPDSSDRSGRKLALHQKQRHSFRPPPVLISLQCAIIALLTVVNVSLLVVCFRYPLEILDPNSIRRTEGLKEYGYSNRTLVSTHQLASSSAQPKLQKEHQNTTYNGKGFLARKPDKNLISSRNCSAVKEGLHSTRGDVSSQAYHSPGAFYQDFQDVVCQFKIFVFTHNAKDPFAKIFRNSTVSPTGSYASEHYFKMALVNSNMLTKDPAEANLFYMPFSLAAMRGNRRILVEGFKHFVRDYVCNISENSSYCCRLDWQISKQSHG